MVYKPSGYQLMIYDSSEKRDSEAICFDGYYAIVGERNSLAAVPVEPMVPESGDEGETVPDEPTSTQSIPIEAYVQEVMAILLEDGDLTEVTTGILTDQSNKCLHTVFPDGNIPVDAEGEPLFNDNQEAAYDDSCGFLENSFLFPHLIGDWMVEDIEVLKYVDSAGEEFLEPLVDLTSDPFL